MVYIARKERKRSRHRAIALMGGWIATAALAATAAPAQAAIGGGAWGFEQVTPVNKSGGTVSSNADAFRASLDGSSLLHAATGSFAGAPADASPMSVRYVARRVGGVWENRAVDPPFDAIPPSYLSMLMMTVGSSENLAYVLVASTRALVPGATEGGGNLYLRDTRTGVYTLVATSPDNSIVVNAVSASGSSMTRYVSPDGDGVMFIATQRLTPDAPTDGSVILYGWTPRDGLYVMSRLPAAEGGAVVGGDAGEVAQFGIRRPIPGGSGGLQRVYFHAVSGSSYEVGGAYLRDGAETVAISRSESTGAVEPAWVVAYSDGGDYALIRTQVGGAPLTDDTPVQDPGDAPVYLYRYSRAQDDLEYVGAYNTGGFAGAGAVHQMSEDGRTIVFQASYELSPGKPDVDMNLYVWRDGELQFVAPAAVSGGPLRLLSENGRFLAVASDHPGLFGTRDTGDSLCPVNGFGTLGPCPEVFLYDTETEELDCVSCRDAGVPQRGGSGDPDVVLPGENLMDQYQPRNVSNDGTVWFTSSNDLLPSQDRNGLRDVYAWHEGKLRLVSRGRQGSSSRFADATPDGTTVFISTDDPIASADRDQDRDIYATGPGIPVGVQDADPPPFRCEGSNCRAGALPVPRLETPGSGARQSDAGREAVDRRASVRIVRTRWSRNVGRVSVRVSGRGRVQVSGQGIVSASRSVSRAGTFVLRTRLSKKSIAIKNREGRVAVRLRASYRPQSGRSVTTTVRKVVR